VVPVTPNVSAPLGDFYAWMLGDRPMDKPGRPGWDEAEFILWNKPTRFAMQTQFAPDPERDAAAADVPAIKLVVDMARLVYQAVRANMSTETIRTAFEQAMVTALRDLGGDVPEHLAPAEAERLDRSTLPPAPDGE
jgi:hypothetical protein